MNESFTETDLQLLLTLVQKAISAERKALTRYARSPACSFNLDDPKAEKYIDRIVKLNRLEEKITAARKLRTMNEQETTNTRQSEYTKLIQELAQKLYGEHADMQLRRIVRELFPKPVTLNQLTLTELGKVSQVLFST